MTLQGSALLLLYISVMFLEKFLPHLHCSYDPAQILPPPLEPLAINHSYLKF